MYAIRLKRTRHRSPGYYDLQCTAPTAVTTIPEHTDRFCYYCFSNRAHVSRNTKTRVVICPTTKRKKLLALRKLNTFNRFNRGTKWSWTLSHVGPWCLPTPVLARLKRSKTYHSGQRYFPDNCAAFHWKLSHTRKLIIPVHCKRLRR